MKKLSLTTVFVLIVLFMGCNEEVRQSQIEMGAIPMGINAFWGDSSAVFVAKELQNGYRISILNNKELCLFHFERGDSISRYFAVHELPFECRLYEDSIGVFPVDIIFPVCKLDTLDGKCPPMFFMDVNFDGEEEFVVAYPGYNREYYACFDLVKGNRNGSCPGLLESTNEPPYNNLVGGGYGHNYTAFNYKNKEIYIYESLGCCAHQETWAKYQNGDEFGFGKGVKVEKSVHYEFSGGEEGKEIVTTYKMVNDTLKIVNIEEIPF